MANYSEKTMTQLTFLLLLLTFKEGISLVMANLWFNILNKNVVPPLGLLGTCAFDEGREVCRLDENRVAMAGNLFSISHLNHIRHIDDWLWHCFGLRNENRTKINAKKKWLIFFKFLRRRKKIPLRSHLSLFLSCVHWNIDCCSFIAFLLLVRGEWEAGEDQFIHLLAREMCINNSYSAKGTHMIIHWIGEFTIIE